MFFNSLTLLCVVGIGIFASAPAYTQAGHYLLSSAGWVADVETDGRQSQWSAGYGQVWESGVVLGAQVVSIADINGRVHSWTGISTHAGIIKPVGKVYTGGTAIIGNIKNCWQWGVSWMVGVPAGYGLAVLNAQYSFLIDDGFRDVPAISIGYSFRVADIKTRRDEDRQ